MGSSKSLRLWRTRTSQCPTRDKPAGTPANLLTHQQASTRDTSKMTVCSASVLLASLSFFLSFFFIFLKASGDPRPLHAPRASPRLSSRNAQRSRLEIPDRRPFLWPKHLDRGPGMQEERGAAHRSPRWNSDTDSGDRGSTARGAPAPGRAGGPRQAEPRVPVRTAAYLSHPAAAAEPPFPARVPCPGRSASAPARRPAHPRSGRPGGPPPLRRRSGRLPAAAGGRASPCAPRAPSRRPRVPGGAAPHSARPAPRPCSGPPRGAAGVAPGPRPS